MNYETRVGRPIDRELFLLMVEAGLSKEDIAHAMRCTINSVSRIAGELGIEMPRKKMRTKARDNSAKILRWFVYYGHTTRNIADELDISSSRVIRKCIKQEYGLDPAIRCKQHSTAVTLREELKSLNPRYLKDLIAKHGTVTNAANALGYPVGLLEHACYYHGFRPPSEIKRRQKIGYKRPFAARRKRGSRVLVSMLDVGEFTDSIPNSE